MNESTGSLDGTSWTNEYRNLGVMNDIVADTAKERASDSTETTCSHHYQLSLLGLSDADDALTGGLA